MAETKEGKKQPHVFRLSRQARDTWVRWYDAHADAVNDPAFDPGEMGADGKLCDFAARLALILHVTHLACDPTATPERFASTPDVSKWAVSGAIKLWSYFRAHHRRVRAYLSGRGL